MSFDAIDAVLKRSRQRSGPLLVLLVIAYYINRITKIAWPSISTLARKAGMSERNVQRCVRALEKAGELEVIRNQGRRGSNIYRILLNEPKNCDADVMGDAGIAKAVSPASPTGAVGVAQSVSEPLRESTPIVPTGDEIDFWVKVCLECFEQPYRPLPERLLYGLARVVPGLDKKNADSLRKFYTYEDLNSKDPPYNSRRHSPERLILDLPRQLALAVQEYPPPRPPKPPPVYPFTLEDVWRYLREKYGDCVLPRTLAALDTPRWDDMRAEILEAMQKKNEKQAP
jgi:biotin operon repressor